MRRLALSLVAISCNAMALDLKDSSWIEIAGPERDAIVECPDVLEFAENAYVYFNDCYAAGQDGVVERGDYSNASNQLKVYNRHYIGSRSIFGADGTTVSAFVQVIDEKTVGLRVAESMHFFERTN